MAFNLKKVLKALLLSSSQPLSIKDVQAAFTRFHEQAMALPLQTSGTEMEPTANAATPSEPGLLPAEEIVEVIEEAPQDPELYGDVPSLITATQVREVMDGIAAELRASDEGLLLIEGNAGYRLVTHPRFARWVRILRQEPPPVKLDRKSVV